MIISIGLVLTHGFPVPEAFQQAYHRLWSRVLSGQANADLPDDLKIADINELRSTAFPVDFARNDIVRTFLAHNGDALLFLDADHVFAPEVLERLMLHRVPVVSARYHMRKPPFHVVGYVKHRTKSERHAYAPVHFGKGLIEIERGGAGCLLIQRPVLEAIRDRQVAIWQAHFTGPTHAALDAFVQSYLPSAPAAQWFRYQHGTAPPHDMAVSEDFWFYQQVREAGFRCYLDWDTECAHLQMMGITRDWNGTYLDEYLTELSTMSPETRQRSLDALVVAGYPEGLTLPTGDRVPPYMVTPGER